MFLIVLDTGAASTVWRTEIAEERVITRNGRRPIDAISTHHTSPR
jgi:hypothetical protein